MGVLQRFERRLEGLVEGTFARVFGGYVQPVEVAAALQREAEDHKAIVGQGRVLVPNVYVVQLSPADTARLQEYDGPLRRELADMVAEHAQEQGWSFIGPVEVSFEQVDELDTGTFRLRSSAAATPESIPQPAPAPTPAPQPARQPHLQLPERGVTTLRPVGPDGVVPLDRAVLVVGRGLEADLQVNDAGVSRRHAELRSEGGAVCVVDLDSTNGTRVNGRRVQQAALHDGDRISVGVTDLVYRSGA